MGDNRYSLPGWLAIVQAVIFPLAFFMSIIQGIIGISVFGYRGPTFGPSDILFIIFTGLSVYTLTMFRKLLNERYNYHDLDLLIIIAICWNIIFQIASLAVRGLVIAMWPLSEIFVTIIYLTFITIAMVTAGIVDILIAVKILRVKDNLNDMIRAFGYVTMVAGLLEATIILSPIALILVPVSCVILALIFLRGKDEVEFV